MSVPMTLGDPERRDAMGPVLPADLHIYRRTVLPTASKFGLTYPGKGEFVGDQPRPILRDVLKCV